MSLGAKRQLIMKTSEDRGLTFAVYLLLLRRTGLILAPLTLIMNWRDLSSLKENILRGAQRDTKSAVITSNNFYNILRF